jgi:transcription termination factor NusB
MVKRARAADRVRVASARILTRWQREHAHVEDLVDQHDRETERGSGAAWDYAERRRLRELVFSCVRLRGRYDHIVSSRSRKSRTPAPELRAIFWIALHELTELDHKAHAVVDEAVRLTEALDVGYARGFVNGLLRGYLREPEGDFPPRADAVAHASTWLSHPQWLVERWKDGLGETGMLELCAANNERPRLYLRARPGRRTALRRELDRLGWEAAEVELLPDALELLTRVCRMPQRSSSLPSSRPSGRAGCSTCARRPGARRPTWPICSRSRSWSPWIVLRGGSRAWRIRWIGSDSMSDSS